MAAGGATVMEVWCRFVGCQGGTIHQAYRRFIELPRHQQEKFLEMLAMEPGLVDTQGFVSDFKDIFEKR